MKAIKPPMLKYEIGASVTERISSFVWQADLDAVLGWRRIV